MAENDLEQLLGGFAADTLTEQERETLFRAALQDQRLFNALADEQALKELLTDPAVRNKLLRVLNQQDIPRSRSWLDRVMKPSTLGWAGGVAVGVLALVLGIRVYEESLQQASETAVVEEERPMAPSPPPQAAPPVEVPLKRPDTQETKAVPKAEPATKDAVPERRRDQTAASPPREKPAVGMEQDEKQRLNLQEESKRINAPVAALGKPSERPNSSSDQRTSQSSAPALEVDVNPPAQMAAGAAIGPSARALFFGQGPAPEIDLRAQEKGRPSGGTPERFALRKTLDTMAPVKPLALRFVIRGSDGQERDANAGRAADSGSVTLTVESNQDAYVQIWRRAGDSLPELVLPTKETGRISLKTAARQPQQITVPQESDRLIVRLSRVPFGPITRQEAVMAGHGSDAQVTESASGTEEPATYLANPDLSATELAIEIPIRTNAPR